MKQLLLVRHAKSSWDDPSMKDFDRPLNERGKRDAPLMAQRLIDRQLAIDGFIASPAKRARKTAEIFAEAYKKDKSSILFLEELYLASAETFFHVISKIPDTLDTIAVFSHNGGITDFANQLSEVRIDNIPTCGIFAVKADIRSWRKFQEAERSFWFFDSPKSNAAPDSI